MDKADTVNGRVEMKTFSLQYWGRKLENWELLQEREKFIREVKKGMSMKSWTEPRLNDLVQEVFFVQLSFSR